jgi:hypothetical protein
LAGDNFARRTVGGNDSTDQTRWTSRGLLPAFSSPPWGIFPENQASGFRVVGVRERLGRPHGRWRDAVLLERRSPAIT